jgi:hypothetical protein
MLENKKYDDLIDYYNIKNNIFDISECIICNDNKEKSKYIKLDCNHIYCIDCLFAYIIKYKN